jgi:16S rRNA (cytosine1402-N4)-methyltransferase
MTSTLFQIASGKPQGANAQMMSDRPDNNSSSQVDPGGFFSVVEPNHDPVMVTEILSDLNLHPGSTVVDGTLGLGGHSRRFVEVIKPGGTLIGFDWDEAMLAVAKQRIGNPSNVHVVLVHDDFREISSTLDRMGMRADGILLDLGLNSGQVDDPDRGFSFRFDSPADMRMDRTRGEPASALLNRMTAAQLDRIFTEYGEERWSRKIALVIVERRKKLPIRTTNDIVDCVFEAVPPKFRDLRIHPATRVFQALRIAVNRELEALDQALIDAARCLSENGVLSVLSYHSGEDRIVKNVFRDLGRDGFKDLHKKPVMATASEVASNPRSRSAKLRSLRREPLGSR